MPLAAVTKLQIILSPQDLKASQLAELALLVLGVAPPYLSNKVPLLIQAADFLHSGDKTILQSNRNLQYIFLNMWLKSLLVFVGFFLVMSLLKYVREKSGNCSAIYTKFTVQIIFQWLQAQSLDTIS